MNCFAQISAQSLLQVHFSTVHCPDYSKRPTALVFQLGQVVISGSGFRPDRIPAASSGTMNNITIGGFDKNRDQPYAYYETIAGGAGAGPLG